MIIIDLIYLTIIGLILSAPFIYYFLRGKQLNNYLFLLFLVSLVLAVLLGIDPIEGNYHFELVVSNILSVIVAIFLYLVHVNWQKVFNLLTYLIIFVFLLLGIYYYKADNYVLYYSFFLFFEVSIICLITTFVKTLKNKLLKN